MSTDEFQQLWKAYDTRLQESQRLNRQLLSEVRTWKVKSSFNWLLASRIFKIVWGIAWNIFCGTLLWRFRSEPVFVVSAALVMLITVIGIVGYAVQLAIIARINYSGSILDTQKQLAMLESVIIRTHRIMILQTPIYTVFYLNKQMIAEMGVQGWIWQGLATGVFVYITIWAYRIFSPANMDKPWMKSIMKNEGWNAISRAREVIKELEEYGAEYSPSPAGAENFPPPPGAEKNI